MTRRRGLQLRLRRRRPLARRQRGIAMLAVITAVAICMVIVNEFGTSTTIDVMQSRNNLDQMRGHFLARSSLNLTELILRLQGEIDKQAAGGGVAADQLKGIQLTQQADSLMAAFGGDVEQVESAIGFSADKVKGLGAGIGMFGVRITPVDGKINVNCAAGSVEESKLVATMLQSLIYPSAFDPIFEEPDGDGWRRDRKTQVTAIIDYIDKDQSKSEIRDDQLQRTSGGEDYGYENLRDTYKAKNDRIDSISELKLVRGVDDRFWTLFGNSFRTYGGCKVNLRAVDDPKIIVAILALAVKDPNDQLLQNPGAMWAIANMILTSMQFGSYFETPEEFAKLAEDPQAFFTELANPTGEGGTANPTPAPAIPGLPQLPPGVTGIVLDPAKLGSVSEAKAVQNYQVEAWGEVAREPLVMSRRTLRAYWNQTHTNQRARNQQLTPTGAWLYLREE